MSLQEDELYYLSSSFDPSSLTIPRLRNILITHDVAYPASAKKAQLVNLFMTEIKPKARNLLAARDQVRRTSRGITNMPSSQEGTVNGDNDDDVRSMPPPPTPRQGKPRTGTRTSAEPLRSETFNAIGAPNTRRHSSKHARQSDTETDQDLGPKRLSARKSRKSETSPVIKIEEPEERLQRPPMRGGVFSDENPFQSGSSPLLPEENRRRTTGSKDGKIKSSSSRRNTEDVSRSLIEQRDGIIPPTAKTFEVPIARLSNQPVQDEINDPLEAGEDFTPEEKLELVRVRAASGKRDILPPCRKKPLQRFGKIPRSAPWVIFLSLLGGYGTWWRQEKLAVGYCGIPKPSNALSDAQLPSWASALQPTCEPCPQHAICYESMETRCEDGFVLQPHPLSLGGVIPLPPTCEPDGEKVRRIKVVADRAVEELRGRKAQAECGTLKDNKGGAISEMMVEASLKQAVNKKRRRGMGDAEFDELWKGAIGDVKARDEIQVSQDGPYIYVSSNSLAHISLACAIRRQARITLARYRLALVILICLTLSGLYVRSLIQKSRTDAARVPALVATTLDRLATQAALYTRGDAAESWISIGQLRDDVLRDEFSDVRREQLWKRVRAIVERNANVRASVREGRGGDVSRVWEWIGSVGLLDEPWSGSRGSGGHKRVTLGGLADGKNSEGGASPNGVEMIDQRKWNEGRPIY